MDLTVAQAAELIGVQPRALRARLARGSLPGRKIDGVWRIRRSDLPLTEAQRERLRRRAAKARGALDDALPSRLTEGRTLLDLDAFRWGVEVLDVLRDDPAAATARSRLAQALQDLGGACHTWDRARKLATLDRARAGAGEAAALLLMAAPLPPTPERSVAATRLECQVAPAIAGLSRWVARKHRGRS